MGSLVVELFTFAKPDLDLDFRILQVKFQRDQRQTVLLHRCSQTADLAFVHQQAAVAAGIAVQDVALFLRTDVDPLLLLRCVVDENDKENKRLFSRYVTEEDIRVGAKFDMGSSGVVEITEKYIILICFNYTRYILVVCE